RRATRRGSGSPSRTSTQGASPPRCACSASRAGSNAISNGCSPPRSARAKSRLMKRVSGARPRRLSRSASPPPPAAPTRAAARPGGRDGGGRAVEEREVGAGELVDRLLRVADDEERRRRRAHELDQLVLEAVRVLQLVDEDGLVARLLVGARGRVAREQRPR